MVYDDAEVLYAEVAQTGKEILDAAFKVLFPGSKHLSSGGHVHTVFNNAESVGDGPIVAVNTTFFPRKEIVALPKAIKTGQFTQTAFGIADCGEVGPGIVKGVFDKSLTGVDMPASGTFIIPVLVLITQSTHASLYKRLRPLCPPQLERTVDDFEWENHLTTGCAVGERVDW